MEQFRTGALEHPDGAWLLECIAGMVEAGESVVDVIRRESLEKAGCEVIELLHLYEFYLAPSGSCERIALYLFRVDVANAGLSHEGEDIRVHALSLEFGRCGVPLGSGGSRTLWLPGKPFWETK